MAAPEWPSRALLLLLALLALQLCGAQPGQANDPRPEARHARAGAAAAAASAKRDRAPANSPACALAPDWAGPASAESGAASADGACMADDDAPPPAKRSLPLQAVPARTAAGRPWRTAANAAACMAAGAAAAVLCSRALQWWQAARRPAATGAASNRPRAAPAELPGRSAQAPPQRNAPLKPQASERQRSQRLGPPTSSTPGGSASTPFRPSDEDARPASDSGGSGGLPAGQAMSSRARHGPSRSELGMQPDTPGGCLTPGLSRVEVPWAWPSPTSPFASESHQQAPFCSSGAATPGRDGAAAGGGGASLNAAAALALPPRGGSGPWHEQQQRRLRGRDTTAVLTELIEHRASQESSPGASGSVDDGTGRTPRQLLMAGLPPSLREWVIPRCAVQYLDRPDGGGPLLLGEGASGRVYKAEWNGEVVAAKEMDIGSSLETQRAFVTEAGRLVLLRHANVVSFYGCALDGAAGILLFEFCEGRDLHSALGLAAAGSRQRLFGWARRGRRVALEVARALNFLHLHGVVHMDIKSSNVLLSASGTAKLADVGLSRLQTRTVMSDVSLVGTFAWVAPEILLGGLNCTKAVDVYSFGVLLWEIITGERPLRGHLRAPRVPEECSQEAHDLMMQCLSTDAHARPSAQHLMQRLARMVDGDWQPAPVSSPR